MTIKKGGLGKGLSALIPTYVDPGIVKDEKPQGIAVLEVPASIDKVTTPQSAVSGGVDNIPVDSIVPNHDQPRAIWREDSLDALANSLKEKGVIQPIVVARRGDKYEIVCGERRWRAAQKAGISLIPAVVKEVVDSEMLETALVENLQREDLNPTEEARAYQKLYEERGLSQDEIAAKVGKDRSTVTNVMRLLRLPTQILEFISQELITMGHARALLALPTEEYQKRFAERIAKENLSVRQVEDLIQKVNRGKRRAKQARKLDGQIIDLERKLEEKFGTQVKIFANKNNQGRIEIRYFSLDDLDRILNTIGIPRD
ncbi:MAG: ParB/RepB/Spo0J family partition protein [Candidatus Omnitrophica bacterium]|nr:ParB/RepB/Spo0J family partition protein [Candidatus Omnitrophota bacterium]